MKQSVPRPAIPGPVNGSTLGYAPQYGDVVKVAGDVRPATHEEGRVTGPVNPDNETVITNPNKYGPGNYQAVKNEGIPPSQRHASRVPPDNDNENGGTGAGQY